MATLEQLREAISGILQDSSFSTTDLDKRINLAVQTIAAGVKLPDQGWLTPPLPDLFSIETKDTVADQAWLEMPDDYHRGLERVTGESLWGVRPPRGGDFYSFDLFMRQAHDKKLAAQGQVYIACLRGRRLYYQGVPASPETLSLSYFRKPETMTEDSSVPEGITDHLQERLIVNYVCGKIFGAMIEDGETSRKEGTQYHMMEFYGAVEEMLLFIPDTTAPFNVPGDNDLAERP